MKLSGKSALVTGASGGIGRAIATELAQWGVRVKATGRDVEALKDVARSTGGEFLAVDLREPAEVDRVAAWAGPVDLLVNNAGFGLVGVFWSLDPDRVEELVRVNLLAPLRLTASLLPAMVERGEGHVVNIASIAGHVGVRHEAAYSATKAALVTFSESLRYELAGTGVGVTVASPGVVDTAFFEREGRSYRRSFPRPLGPGRVARATVRAIGRNQPQVFIPRWMAFPAWLQGTWPALYRRLAGRFH